MDPMKGIADVVEHLLYETFGLLVPGATLVFGLGIVAGGEVWPSLLEFSGTHPWLTLGGAYLTGYVIQGLSRPLITTAEGALALPSALLRNIPRIGPRFQAAANAVETRLGGRHRRGEDTVAEGQNVDLDALVAAHWERKLALTGNQRLSSAQAVDLAFSAILAERRQLDRFRSATSLCRGVAAVVVVLFLVLVVQLALGARGLSPGVLGMLGGFLLVFYGLLERADMYAKLWRAVVPAQFLASLPETETRLTQEVIDAVGD